MQFGATNGMKTASLIIYDLDNQISYLMTKYLAWAYIAIERKLLLVY